MSKEKLKQNKPQMGFGGGHGRGMSGEKAKNFKGTIPDLLNIWNHIKQKLQ